MDWRSSCRARRLLKRTHAVVISGALMSQRMLPVGVVCTLTAVAGGGCEAKSKGPVNSKVSYHVMFVAPH